MTTAGRLESANIGLARAEPLGVLAGPTAARAWGVSQAEGDRAPQGRHGETLLLLDEIALVQEAVQSERSGLLSAAGAG
jgi:hypothetical protein